MEAKGEEGSRKMRWLDKHTTQRHEFEQTRGEAMACRSPWGHTGYDNITGNDHEWAGGEPDDIFVVFAKAMASCPVVAETLSGTPAGREALYCQRSMRPRHSPVGFRNGTPLASRLSEFLKVFLSLPVSPKFTTDIGLVWLSHF